RQEQFYTVESYRWSPKVIPEAENALISMTSKISFLVESVRWVRGKAIFLGNRETITDKAVRKSLQRNIHYY
ncbi:MAG TPA: hypothetical protein VE616_00035, partial [Candidatus Udaeobacter sp.]|nr:hypothetical protein [Candidatus Udaeobacter sp.]